MFLFKAYVNYSKKILYCCFCLLYSFKPFKIFTKLSYLLEDKTGINKKHPTKMKIKAYT